MLSNTRNPRNILQNQPSHLRRRHGPPPCPHPAATWAAPPRRPAAMPRLLPPPVSRVEVGVESTHFYTTRPSLPPLLAAMPTSSTSCHRKAALRASGRHAHILPLLAAMPCRRHALPPPCPAAAMPASSPRRHALPPPRHTPTSCRRRAALRGPQAASMRGSRRHFSQQILRSFSCGFSLFYTCFYVFSRFLRILTVQRPLSMGGISITTTFRTRPR